MMKLEDESLKFENAALIVLENILASGYGPFVPETDGSIIFNSILMVIGRFIVCYILRKFYSFITNYALLDISYDVKYVAVFFSNVP